MSPPTPRNTQKRAWGSPRWVLPHLVEEQLAPLLLAQVHLLDGHQLAGALDSGDADDAGGALADLDEVVQVGAGVAGIHHHLQRRPELLVGDALGLALGRAGLLRPRRGRRGAGGRLASEVGVRGVRGEAGMGRLGVFGARRTGRVGSGGAGTAAHRPVGCHHLLRSSRPVLCLQGDGRGTSATESPAGAARPEPGFCRCPRNAGRRPPRASNEASGGGVSRARRCRRKRVCAGQAWKEARKGGEERAEKPAAALETRTRPAPPARPAGRKARGGRGAGGLRGAPVLPG